ncbi:MAG: hypothetical protein IJI59_10495, partial [Clostridia bacterium]|nr:hypothetical protein [Clostridia bacterium]
ATREGVRSLRAFYEDYGLEGTCDLCAGSWPSGPVPMNGLCLLPTGEAFVPCERLVLWDAGPEAYANLPPHRRLYVARGGDDVGWPLALPDVKTLRTVYLAARWLGSKGMRRVTLSDIERDVALTCGVEDDATIQAALAVLSHMGLIALDRAGASLTIPPVKKLNPEDDPLFQRLNRIRRRFSAKE